MNSTPQTSHKPRHYRQITKDVVARFIAAKAIHGNGTSAVRSFEPTQLAPHSRAFMIAKKSNGMNSVDFIDEQLQRIGIDAVNRIGLLVNSNDERIGAKMAMYVVDHLRGKPLQRLESKHLSLNIQTVLD